MDLSNIQQLAPAIGPDHRHAAGLARRLFGDTNGAPIVSDQELDRLGRRFLAAGGNAVLGSFEDFVRRAHHQTVNVEAYRRAQLRRALDLKLRAAP